MPRSTLLLILLLTALGPLASPSAQDGLHLSSFESRLAARLDRDGSLDGGAGVIQLVDPDTGRPFSVSGLAYGPEPNLWAGWQVPGVDVDLQVRALAAGSVRNGDERLRSMFHLTFDNPSGETRTVRVGVQLRPGGGMLRPRHAPVFSPDSVWGREGDLITRDGTALLAWSGPEPEVRSHAAPTLPDDPVFTLVWELELDGGMTRFIDLVLLSGPTTPIVDEQAWRSFATQWSYQQVEEQLRWQSLYRGEFANLATGVPLLDTALVTGVHFLRSLGDAHKDVRWLTDHPYGDPPTDAAVPAEIVGIFAEWGLFSWVKGSVKRQLAALPDAAEPLDTARRVALLHGLSRALRLADEPELTESLAGAIGELLDGRQDEQVPVAPWLDPEEVTADLADLLAGGDPAAVDAALERLPELLWAAQPEGPVARTMLEARRALSDGDAPAAWAAMETLLAGANVNGLGSMRPGGDPDGTFSMGLLSLGRAILMDDHGPDLHLLPGVVEPLIAERAPLEMPFLPTRHGEMLVKMFRLPGDRVGVRVRSMFAVRAERVLVHLPAGLQPKAVGDRVGGKARLLREAGLVEVELDPGWAGGLGFTVRRADD
jgi:hypothetical protein